MPKKHHPRRGSLAYMPRVRAPRPIAHVRAWPAEARLSLQGFVGYKAGMTQVFLIDDRKNSLTAGQEICLPATAIDVPPLIVSSIKLYEQTALGFNTLTQIWASDLSKDLARTINVPKRYDFEKVLEKAERLIQERKVTDIRVVAHTQPRIVSVPKKKPELVEIRVGGGSIEERWKYAKDLPGKEVRIADVFKSGEYVDVLAITKGKGFQGPVKRRGIKILPRKTRGVKRKVGAIGPWTPPRVMWTVPGAGQMGYHQRTEFNKRILKLGTKGSEVTPRGGFLRYGPLKGDFVLLAGSIPGLTNRLMNLRQAIRPPKGAPTTPPSITSIDTSSKQGA